MRFLIFIFLVLSVVAEQDKIGKFKIEESAIPRKYYEEVDKRWLDNDIDVPKGEFIKIETRKGQKIDQVVWDVVVPESYDPKRPIGIVSFITPGAPNSFKPLLKKHNLILIVLF